MNPSYPLNPSQTMVLQECKLDLGIIATGWVCERVVHTAAGALR